jgi:hypothetical protein
VVLVLVEILLNLYLVTEVMEAVVEEEVEVDMKNKVYCDNHSK